MRSIALATASLLIFVPAVHAGHISGFGEFGFGGHHHGFGGARFGVFGFGYRMYGSERQQSRLEDQLDDLMEEYEAGLMEITDFYSSDEYTQIVGDTERLADRYEMFLSSVERSVDRLTDFIEIANEDLTYYSDLLADYQADPDLSEERLERLERWITRTTDRIAMQIDLLTDKQTTFEENLPSYQSFQEEVNTFLADIIAAAGGTTDEATTTLASLTSIPVTSQPVLAILSQSTAACESAQLRKATTAVPEPRTWMMAALALGVVAMHGSQRSPPLRNISACGRN